MLGAQRGRAGALEPRALLGAARPRVPEPERRQQVERRRVRPAIRRADLDEQVLGRGLRVVDLDVEVPALLEDARVEQLVLHLARAAAPVLLDEVAVRERRLRVLVEPPHPRVGGRRVEEEVVLLEILAVVPLDVREAERALLEDRVALVPQCEPEAEELLLVADAREPVLAPAVRARAGLVVGEALPRVPVGAHVLTDGAPLPLRQVRAPAPPRRCVAQPLSLARHRRLPSGAHPTRCRGGGRTRRTGRAGRRGRGSPARRRRARRRARRGRRGASSSRRRARGRAGRGRRRPSRWS